VCFGAHVRNDNRERTPPLRQGVKTVRRDLAAFKELGQPLVYEGDNYGRYRWCYDIGFVDEETEDTGYKPLFVFRPPTGPRGRAEVGGRGDLL
jgi:hypothetical protein